MRKYGTVSIRGAVMKQHDDAGNMRAWMMGTIAFYGGDSLDDNPFPNAKMYEELHVQWKRGWNSARQEVESA